MKPTTLLLPFVIAACSGPGGGGPVPNADGSASDACGSGSCDTGDATSSDVPDGTLLCVATQRRCTDAGSVEQCDDEARWLVIEDCASRGLTCVAGTCRSPCQRDPKANDNSGCDYWAIDLDNHPLAQNGPYAVIVSNLSAQPASVKVSAKDGPVASPAVVLERDVEPGQLEILDLPNRNMGGAGLFWTAYRIESTVPIVAFQFNPLDNVDVFSNDATILIPSNTFGKEYFVVSRKELIGSGATPEVSIPYRSMFAVVAANSATKVTVVPTCRTQGGFDMPVMTARLSYTFTLEPYEVLNVKSDETGGDLTGTLVTSDKPIAVFGGHEAALTSNVCCADHLEHQMFPVSTWGTLYVASKSMARQAESDYWRIMAAEDHTVVNFDPAIAPPRTLDRGEWIEIPTRSDFVVSANLPISVAQTLASSGEVVSPHPYADCTATDVCATQYRCEVFDSDTGQAACLPPRCVPGTFTCPIGHVCTEVGPGQGACTAVGDPTLIMLAPVKQFRTDYVFLSPNKYAEDYINIVAPADASVTLDGTLVAADQYRVVSSSSWKVARLRVVDGVHRVLGDRPIGVIAYGWDRDVSYGYSAGLNLVVDD